MTNFESDEVNIKKLFEDSYQVPDYQREYSWTEKQIKSFVVDILNIHKSKIENYFFGPMVFIPKMSHKLVIDGQQRLAIFTILLCVIRDIYKQYEKNPGTEITKLLFSTSPKKSHVKLNDINHDFFNNKILDDTTKAETKVNNLKTMSFDHSSDRLLSKTYQIIYQELSKKISNTSDLPKIKKIINYVLKSSKVVRITAGHNEAHLIFETLNERGIPLTKSDLLKNYLIRIAGPSESKTIFNNWKKLSQNVGDNPDVFLRHYCISHYGKTSGNELYSKFMRENPKKKDVLELSTSLASASKIYANLLNPTMKAFQDKDIVNDVTALKSLQSTVFLPILLCAKEKKMKNKHFKQLTKMCVALFVRYKTILGFHPTKLETLAVNTCEQIRKGKKPCDNEIKELFTKLMPPNTIFRENFERHVQPENRIATYLLKNIFTSTKLDLIATDPISLEHVIPQDVDRHANDPSSHANVQKWLTYMNSNRLTVNDVYRLGNMALLLAPDNSEVGDKPFKDKKIIFKKYSIPFTKEISKVSRWNRNIIDSRQKKFANKAVRIWKI